MKKIRKTILRAFAKVKNDHNHWRRRIIGIALIICGLIGPFVPILGLWMLPLGIILVSLDQEWYKNIKKKLRHRSRTSLCFAALVLPVRHRHQHRHKKVKQKKVQQKKK